jgi:hypothetical protein
MPTKGRQFESPPTEQPEAMVGRAELVPVEHLKKFVHLDRTNPEEASYSPEHLEEHLNSLATDIKAGKLRNPVQIEYDHDSQWGSISEGHHRILAAERAGVTHLPATVIRGYQGGYTGKLKMKGKGAAMSIKPDAMLGTWKEHVPAEARPSDFENLPSIVRKDDETK